MNGDDPFSPLRLSMESMPSTGPEAIGRARPGGDPRIQAAIEGRKEAAESLLLELLPRVRNLVRYLVRGDVDVEDISQEALIALLRGLSTYRGEGSFPSWVDRVVARTTFAWLKRARGVEARRGDEPAELMAVPSGDAPPDEYVHRRRMVMLLDRIPDEQRHAMVMHHVLGLSVVEVSNELGIPFETIRSRLRLGKAALRALAGGDDGAPGRGTE